MWRPAGSITAALWLTLIGVADAAAQQAATARIDLRVEQANLSFAELQRLVPALENVTLPDDLVVERLQARGPVDALTLDFLFRSRSSRITGQVTGNFQGPRRTARGGMSVASLDLVELLDNPSLPSDLTGEATFDLTFETGGDVPSITGDYALRVDRVALEEYVADDIAISGRFDRQALVVQDMSAQVFGGRVTAEGRVGLPLGGRTLTYDLSGSVARVNLARLPDTLPVPDLDGRVSLSYSVRDRGQGPSGRARLAETRVAGATIASGTTLTFDMTGDEVTYTARGRMSGLDPQALGETFEIEALTDERLAGTTLNAEFSAEGRGMFVHPLEITLTDSTVLGGRIPDLRAAVTLTTDSIAVVGSGRFEELELDRAVPDVPDGVVTGSIDVDAAVPRVGDTFEWRRAAGDAVLQLEASRVAGVPIDRLAFRASARDEVVHLGELTVEGPTVSANAEGTIALNGEATSQATYTITVPDLSSFSALAGTALAGDVRLQGEVTGSGPLRVAGTIAATNLDVAGMQTTTLNVTHDATVPPGDPVAARVQADVEAAFVRVAGRTLTTVALDADYQGQELTFDADLREADQNMQAAGRFVLLPEGEGQEVHLTSFRFEAPGATWALPAGAPARIDFGPERIVVDDLRLETSDGQAIAAAGVLGRTTAEGPLEVSISNLSLEAHDALLFGDRGVAGSLNVDASLAGPLDSPGVTATAVVENGAVRGYAYERLEAAVESNESAFLISARLQQDPQAWLDAEGAVPRALVGGDPGPDAQMDVRVTSSPLDLAFVGGFTDMVRNVQGTLQADVSITGTPDAPRFGGEVAIAGGAFEVPDLGTLYTGLDTTITFEPEALVIREFLLLDENDQPMRVAGRLPYFGAESREVIVEVETDNFEIIDNEMGDVQVSTNLTISGTLVAPRLEGSIRVTDATLRVDRIVDLGGEEYYRAEPVGDGAVDAEEAPPAVEGLMANVPLALALDLQVPSVLLAGRDIRGPGAAPIGLGNVNLTVSGDLRLNKDLEGPLVITGDVTTVRGYYEFQGRRFEVLRDGRVGFPGLPEINPLLDITARRTISGVQADIVIGGTLQEPELTLSSQPPLDEADILSLIVFNQPANQLGTAEQVSLGRRAAALAGGFVASQLAESIGGAFELDILEIDTGASAGGAAGVTVGEQIGERLFLRVRQGFGAAGATQLMVEYEFTDWLRLQSTVSDERGGSESLFQRSERSGVNWIFLFSY